MVWTCTEFADHPTDGCFCFLETSFVQTYFNDSPSMYCFKFGDTDPNDHQPLTITDQKMLH
jgi:hypothetical protein